MTVIHPYSSRTVILLLLLVLVFVVVVVSHAWQIPTTAPFHSRWGGVVPSHRRPPPTTAASSSSSSSSSSSMSRSFASSSSSTTTTAEGNGSGGSSTTTGTTPMLRGLYDPPPPPTTKKTSSLNDNDDPVMRRHDGWTTEVTSGTMIAEDGSPHVVYYEVHRRRRRRRRRPPASSSSSSGGSDDGATDEREPDDDDDDDDRATTTSAGLTALFLHGGPGAGCYPNHVRFFDPSLWEIVVLLDQRGCGRSVPIGEVYTKNDLESLVSDVERLRHRLLGHRECYRGADDEGTTTTTTTTTTTRPWDAILGGSWGCTLALAYAHAHPRCVRSMVLRGVCLFRPREVDWLFGDPPPPTPMTPPTGNGIGIDGAVAGTSNLRSLLEGRGGGRASSSSSSSSTTTAAPGAATSTVVPITTVTTAAEVFPKGWEEFRKGSEPRRDLAPRSPFNNKRGHVQAAQSSSSRRVTLHRYYHLLLGPDPVARYNAVKSWLRWEMGIYSSGFRGREKATTLDEKRDGNNNDGEEGTKEDSIDNTVLVWYPHEKSWTYEDARVWNNASFVSIGVENSTRTTPAYKMAQSLRRFSSSRSTSTLTSSLARTSLKTSDGVAVGPMPVQPAVTIPIVGKSTIPLPTTTTMMGDIRGNNNSSFDPATYIPAQSMLTAFYSVNDDYCIGRYKSFLSLELPPPPEDAEGIESSWYSSALPPRMPQYPPSSLTSSCPESSLMSSTASSSFPLPPTIAIQGGNDAICPPDTALDLHDVWKELELRIVVQSGHSMYDPLIAGEIVKALDRFGHSLKENE